jgi:hypothetical protein
MLTSYMSVPMCDGRTAYAPLTHFAVFTKNIQWYYDDFEAEIPDLYCLFPERRSLKSLVLSSTFVSGSRVIVS